MKDVKGPHCNHHAQQKMCDMSGDPDLVVVPPMCVVCADHISKLEAQVVAEKAAAEAAATKRDAAVASEQIFERGFQVATQNKIYLAAERDKWRARAEAAEAKDNEWRISSLIADANDSDRECEELRKKLEAAERQLELAMACVKTADDLLTSAVLVCESQNMLDVLKHNIRELEGWCNAYVDAKDTLEAVQGISTLAAVECAPDIGDPCGDCNWCRTNMVPPAPSTKAKTCPQCTRGRMVPERKTNGEEPVRHYCDLICGYEESAMSTINTAQTTISSQTVDDQSRVIVGLIRLLEAFESLTNRDVKAQVAERIPEFSEILRSPAVAGHSSKWVSAEEHRAVLAERDELRRNYGDLREELLDIIDEIADTKSNPDETYVDALKRVGVQLAAAKAQVSELRADMNAESKRADNASLLVTNMRGCLDALRHEVDVLTDGHDNPSRQTQHYDGRPIGKCEWKQPLRDAADAARTILADPAVVDEANKWVPKIKLDAMEAAWKSARESAQHLSDRIAQDGPIVLEQFRKAAAYDSAVAAKELAERAVAQWTAQFGTVDNALSILSTRREALAVAEAERDEWRTQAEKAEARLAAIVAALK